MKRQKKRKITFANLVITVCVVVAVLVTGCVVWEYHRLETVIPSSVITALFAFWGGELLIVALRQIFGSDVTRSKPTNAGAESSNESNDTTNIFGGSI